MDAGSSWEPKPRELPSAVPGASVEGISSLNLAFQILLIRDGTYASMSTSPEGLGRNLFSFSLLPYLVLSVGGQMTNKIVPSYLWVFQEYARTKLCPFVLLESFPLWSAFGI